VCITIHSIDSHLNDRASTSLGPFAHRRPKNFGLDIGRVEAFLALSITSRKLSKGFSHSAIVLRRHFLRHRAV
jgi:hypothetical protein